MNSITTVPDPVNEPVRSYAAESQELAALLAEAHVQRSSPLDLPAFIGGEWDSSTGTPFEVREPHRASSVLGISCNSTEAQAERAINAAADAAAAWAAMPFDERAAIFLRAADLLAGRWRNTLNAATMLGQSKTVLQAEIDSACELADFWRFNVAFGRQIIAGQPAVNSPGTWNRLDYRALEGFVYAITPFNFTAIAGNLPTAPALMGNTVLWKPAPTQQLAAHHTMRLLQEAGLPSGVINMLPGDGRAVSGVALKHPSLAGIHFTGSTATFRHLWATVAGEIGRYNAYPRIVGETGGKGFVLAHGSADPAALRTALIRGAFEYQGQKCSAASRAYIPKSLWTQVRDDLCSAIDSLTMGDVTDPSNFMGAVIDGHAYRKHVAAIDAAHADPACEVLAGGKYDATEGWFVRPTLVQVDALDHEMFSTEYFGPILAVYVYEDDAFNVVAAHVADSAYALTGAVFGTDRAAICQATELLRNAAGNFYVNDKPTGAVVGQQPFGGARASGTNDKAGSADNLRRWTSVRTIKENFDPPREHVHPHQGLS